MHNPEGLFVRLMQFTQTFGMVRARCANKVSERLKGKLLPM